MITEAIQPILILKVTNSKIKISKTSTLRLLFFYQVYLLEMYSGPLIFKNAKHMASIWAMLKLAFFKKDYSSDPQDSENVNYFLNFP